MDFSSPDGFDDSKFEGSHEHPDNTPAPDVSSDEAFAAVHGYSPSESPEQAAKEMLKEALVPAIQSITHIAAFGENERTRLDAAKYIAERNLGKIAANMPMGDMWDELFKEIETRGQGGSTGNP